MRTNIDLDDELMKRAAKILGTKTKKATVEAALKEVVRQRAMEDLLKIRITIDPEDVRPGIEASKQTQKSSA